MPSFRDVLAQEPEHVDDAYYSGSDRYDEEGRKETEDEREHQLGADLGCKFLGPLHTLVAEFLCVHAQCFADAGAKLQRLDQQADQAADVLERRVT